MELMYIHAVITYKRSGQVYRLCRLKASLAWAGPMNGCFHWHREN